MDLFTKKCSSCNAILRRLEQCVSCTDKRRVEAIAMAGPRKPPKPSYKISPPEYRAELIRDLRTFSTEAKVVEVPAKVEPFKIQWASPEHMAKALEQTAAYQARRVQRRR